MYYNKHCVISDVYYNKHCVIYDVYYNKHCVMSDVYYNKHFVMTLVDKYKQSMLHYWWVRIPHYLTWLLNWNINCVLFLVNSGASEGYAVPATSGIRRVNLVTNPVISRKWGKDWEVFTTSETYPWSFVTHIFHNGQPSHGGDRKTFEVMTST